MLAFEDKNQKVLLYDITNNCIRAQTKPLQKQSVPHFKFGDEKVTHNTGWCTAGDFILLQFESSLQISHLPYQSLTHCDSAFSDNGFEFLDGLFVAVFGGGKSYSTAPFGWFYKKAFKLQDLDALRMPIYPYRVNALHYFALSGNDKALSYCLQNGVLFTYDCFGKSPLNYAIKSQNLNCVNALFASLLSLDEEQAKTVLSQININQMLQEVTPDLGAVFKKLGTTEPKVQSFHKTLTMPQNYLINLDQINFASSQAPIYNHHVQQLLHGKEVDDDAEDTQLIETKVLSNPVPKDYTLGSL